MSKKYTSIADYASDEDLVPPIDKPDEHLDKTVYLQSWEWKKGEHGEFLHLTLSNEPDGNTFIVSTGASVIVGFIRSFEDTLQLPMAFRFYTKGKMIGIAAPLPDL